MRIPIEHAPARGRSGGFTLIELLVVVAVVGVMVGLLLPAVQMAREAANRDTAAHHLGQVAIMFTQLEATSGAFPASIDELAATCAAAPRSCDVDPDVLDGMAAGYRFDVVAAGAWGFWLTAVPAAPGLTGSETLFVDASGSLYTAPTPGADEAREVAFASVHVEAMRIMGDTLNAAQTATVGGAMTETLGAALSETLSPDVWSLLDVDADGALSAAEVFGVGAPGVDDEAGTLAGFLASAREIFAVGAGDEDPFAQRVSR